MSNKKILSTRAEFIDDDPDFEEDELKYKTIVEYCRQNNTMYHDGEMPHVRKSFMPFKVEWKEEWRMGYKRLKTKVLPTKSWKRLLSEPSYASEYDDHTYWNWTLLQPAIVYQQSLPNCGLVAALSAASTIPSILDEIFQKPMCPKYGIYQVRLCVDGVWKTVIADDGVPTVKDHLLVARSPPLNWAPLVEKAIAKARGGSYANLKGYSCQDGLAILTGSPILTLAPKNDDCWDLLRNASISDYPMTCATYAEDKDNQGLSSKHAFTLLGVAVLDNHKIVHIRNPSGSKNWEGKWSLTWCLEQTPRPTLAEYILLRHKMDITGEYLEWTDFVRIFDTVSICRYRPSWNTIRASLKTDGTMDGTQKMIRISVPERCEICVSSQQKDSNEYQRFTWLIIYHINQFDPNSIGDFVHLELIQDYSKDIELPSSGDYVILFSSFPFVKFQKERTIAIHSSIPISAKIIDWNPYSLAAAFQSTVEKFGNEYRGVQRNDMSVKEYEISDFNTTTIIMATNYNYNQYLHIHLYPKIASGKWFFSRDSCSDYLADVIPPRSRQILIVAKPKARRDIEFGHRIDFWFSDEKLTKVGRSNREEHLPRIEPWNYLHCTIAI